MIEISPGIPPAGAIGTAIRPARRRRYDPCDAVRLALIAFALGLSAPAAAEESRTPAEFVAAPAVASAAPGGQLVLGAMDRSGKRWIVAAASAPDAGSSTPPAAASAPAGRYVALIIANSAYPTAPLTNPSVDAGLVADSLSRIGFAVVVKKDLDLEGFEQALNDFGETAKGADVALFYFAGHGFSVAVDDRQENFLMTTSVNFQAKTAFALQQGGEPLGHLESTIIGRARATLIFIDACRNVPNLPARGASSRGFAPLGSSLEGAYVVFSTRAGNTAGDGETGEGSPFARAFAAVAPTPGMRIEDVAATVRDKVSAETGKAQVPDVVRSDLPVGGVTLVETRGSPRQPVASLESTPEPKAPLAAALTPAFSSPAAAPAPSTVAPAAAISVGPPPKIAANDSGGEVFKECDECPEMVVVPAGKASLGSPLGESGRQTFEAAPHTVEIARPLAVGRYAVTFAQWDACFAQGGCGHRQLGDLDFGRGKRPAIFATWTDAQLYVQWLKRKTGQPYRLLSEAEWEYAARGCKSLRCSYAPFWFGAIKPELAVYDSRRSYDGSPKADARLKTEPVDNGPPNPFGLYNMLGNVRQWTQDCWNPTPLAVASSGAPVLSGDCDSRVTRGGSWADAPGKLRAAARDYDSVDEQSERVGFRVARDLEP